MIYDMKPFGAAIRARRRERDLTLVVSAKALGISVTYLHDLEGGKKKRPKMDLLRAIAAYYGLNEDDVIVQAGRIPADVYYKIVNNPSIIETLRKYEV